MVEGLLHSGFNAVAIGASPVQRDRNEIDSIFRAFTVRSRTH